MNAVIPAGYSAPLRRHGRSGRDRRREECTVGEIQVNDPIMPRPNTSLPAVGAKGD